MGSSRDGICILCEQQERLCNSHIIPEFCYRSMYDEDHRALVIRPVDPDSAKPMLQKGLRSRLLCSKCERDVNDWYEKPFQKFWYGPEGFARLKGVKGLVLQGFDYASFKLFHLSVLLRACRSHHANFSEVVLPEKHEEEIRRMVRERDPGPSSKYPILCCAVDDLRGGVWESVVLPAHRFRLDGHTGYCFTFAGGQWLYLVSSHPWSQSDELALRESGQLPVAVRPSLVVRKYAKEFQRLDSADSHQETD